MNKKGAAELSMSTIIIIIIGVVWYAVNKNKIINQVVPSIEQTVQTQNNQAEINKIEASPLMMVGIVSKIEGQKITLTVRADEKTIIVDEKTIITKEFNHKPPFKNVPATFGDIKMSSRIVVYYSQDSGSQYTADKIQMFNF